MNLLSLIRENIKNLDPYVSARSEYDRKSGIFLDANENPFGIYNRYPDPFQRKLKEKIGEIKSISQSKIFLGNGSDEIIDLIFRIFCEPLKDKALTFYPTYGMYRVSSQLNQVELIEILLDDNFQINLDLIKPYYINPIFKIIFICSPNNPTGNLFSIDSVEEILKKFKGIIVIDEAYIDFSNSESFIHRLDEFPNLIVMQTFSKAFGLANIRVGLAFSNEKILYYFNKIKFPYNISGINQNAVLERLNNYTQIKNEIHKILIERDRLIIELEKNKKVKKIYPSDANFILLEIENADVIYDFLIKNKIIVRNRSKIIKECLRITIGSENENNELINILKT